jgi:hypothetical protein
MSGRDLRHFSRELKKEEQEHARVANEAGLAYEEADRALAKAHRLHCQAWGARLFIGGRDDPSPSIADALHGDVPLLEVQCRHCNHGEVIDLALVIWPRERPIRTLQKVLFCRPCMETIALLDFSPPDCSGKALELLLAQECGQEFDK